MITSIWFLFSLGRPATSQVVESVNEKILGCSIIHDHGTLFSEHAHPYRIKLALNARHMTHICLYCK